MNNFQTKHLRQKLDLEIDVLVQKLKMTRQSYSHNIALTEDLLDLVSSFNRSLPPLSCEHEFLDDYCCGSE